MICQRYVCYFFLFFYYFFFNDTATTEIYTLSLHDALPISARMREITLGEHSEWTIVNENYRGVATGIDIRLVVETGIVPTINTGIAHRQPGIGQVGAGVVKAPLACFEKALRALGERLGLS